MNLALGDEVSFSAAGFGGSTVLKYSWDFDDKDGIQEDAVGQSVRHKFRKPGTYTITLTIADAYGLKKPYTTTMKAVVNP
jgi:PKD repeat protein